MTQSFILPQISFLVVEKVRTISLVTIILPFLKCSGISIQLYCFKSVSHLAMDMMVHVNKA